MTTGTTMAKEFEWLDRLGQVLVEPEAVRSRRLHDTTTNEVSQ
jgi:hypothetical protein